VKKNLLVIGDNKFSINKNHILYFFNEFSYDLYKGKYNSQKILKFINSYKDDAKYKKTDERFLKKRILRYRKELTIKLNKIHKLSYDKNYWGIILDKYLFIILQEILCDKKTIEKFLKKKKNFTVHKELIKIDKINSLNDFLRFESKENFSKLIKSKIISFIKPETSNKFKYKIIKLNNKKNNLINFIFKKIISLIIKFFNPILLVNVYFGKYKSLRIILKSFGKILIVNERLMFDVNFKEYKYDKNLRKKIQVSPKDDFDKIFNEINRILFPGSFLENFNQNLRKIKYYQQHLKNLGTGMCLNNNDQYKLLAAEMQNEKGKLISFQHGGNFEKFNYSIQDEMEKDYCWKRFLWHQKGGIGDTYLSKFKQIEHNSKKNNILLLPTMNKFNDCSLTVFNRSLKKKYNPFSNLNYLFYKSLSSDKKQKTVIKLFPSKTSFRVEKIWRKKFGKNLRIHSELNKKSYDFYKKSRIIVLDDISTPIYETMYLNIPSILILEDLHEFKKEFQNKIKKLSKLNFYFKSPISAASFINKNINNIDEWWSNISKDKDFLKFKRELFTKQKKNQDNQIINILLKN
tara:strand:+ start:2358 stop:4082 length:1725 start_codon:yes stop_codon:yes gene_type:complete